MRRLRALYFLYYAGVGAFLSYFAPYLRGLGFTGSEVGAISMVSQVCSLVAALFWAQLADRVSVRVALRYCAAGAFAAACGLPLSRTPLAMGLSLAVFSLFSGAVVPLVDSVTVELARAQGVSYARNRLWGSLGFIVTAQGVGFALSARGDRPGDVLMPLAYLACVVGWAAAAQNVPRIEVHGERPHWRDALELLRGPRLLFWLVLCTLHWGALAPYHLMFGVLVRDRGLPASVTGMSTALGVAGEVLALFAFPWLEKRFSLRALMAVSFVASIARWLLVSAAQSAFALVSLQLLHALTFGLWWGAAVEGMTRIVPARLRATGQALFSAIVFGVGNGAGYVLAGRGYDALGSAAALFPLAAAVEAVPLLLLLLPLTPERERA